MEKNCICGSSTYCNPFSLTANGGPSCVGLRLGVVGFSHLNLNPELQSTNKTVSGLDLHLNSALSLEHFDPSNTQLVPSRTELHAAYQLGVIHFARALGASANPIGLSTAVECSPGASQLQPFLQTKAGLQGQVDDSQDEVQACLEYSNPSAWMWKNTGLGTLDDLGQCTLRHPCQSLLANTNEARPIESFGALPTTLPSSDDSVNYNRLFSDAGFPGDFMVHSTPCASNEGNGIPRDVNSISEDHVELEFGFDSTRIVVIGSPTTSNQPPLVAPEASRQLAGQSNRRGRGVQSRKHLCTDPACERTFSSRRDRKRHIDSVHRRLQDNCPQCGKQFTRRGDNLKRHMKNYCSWDKASNS